MGLTLFSLITLIFLLIFSERIAIRVVGADEIDVIVYTTFFSFKANRINAKRRRSKSVPFPFILNLLGELLPRTDVICRSLDISALGTIVKPSALISVSIASPILLSYVKSKTNAFEFADESEFPLDVIFIFSLFSLFISSLKSSYYLLKKNATRRKRNARGWN